MNKYVELYIEEIEKGNIIVNKDIKQAIKLIKQMYDQYDCFFDDELIERFILFTEKNYFPLLLWQKFVFATGFAFFFRESAFPEFENGEMNLLFALNGQRVFNELLLLAGRGVGKNGLISAIAEFHISPLFPVLDYGVDIIANSEKQALRSFNDVKKRIDSIPELKRIYKTNKEIIVCKKTGSEFQYLTSGASSKDSLRSGMVIFDEIHEMRDFKNMRTLISGVGKRKWGMKVYITTDGEVRGLVIDDFKERAGLILDGTTNPLHDRLLPLLYRLDEKSEWEQPEMWEKAIPSFQKPINSEIFKALKAEVVSAFFVSKTDKQQYKAFMTKRMNLPTEDMFEGVASWDVILKTNKEIPDLSGTEAIGAIDYASLRDFCAVGLLFKQSGKVYFIQHTFVTKQALEATAFNAPIDQWAEQGMITILDEPIVNKEVICDWFDKQREKYYINYIACDRYRVSVFKDSLEQRGYELKLIGNGYVTHNFVYPIIEQWLQNEQLIFGNAPIMRWYTNNVKVVIDPKGNHSYQKIEPRKRKTDGFMAFVACAYNHDLLESYTNEDFEIFAG